MHLYKCWPRVRFLPSHVTSHRHHQCCSYPYEVETRCVPTARLHSTSRHVTFLYHPVCRMVSVHTHTHTRAVGTPSQWTGKHLNKCTRAGTYVFQVNHCGNGTVHLLPWTTHHYLQILKCTGQLHKALLAAATSEDAIPRSTLCAPVPIRGPG